MTIYVNFFVHCEDFISLHSQHATRKLARPHGWWVVEMESYDSAQGPVVTITSGKYERKGAHHGDGQAGAGFQGGAAHRISHQRGGLASQRVHAHRQQVGSDCCAHYALEG